MEIDVDLLPAGAALLGTQLTLLDLMTLEAIRREPGLSQKAVRTRYSLPCTRQNMSLVTNKLIGLGYAEQSFSEWGGRDRMLSLTASGLELLRGLNDELRECVVIRL